MPYTRIKLITTGVIKAELSCDLETGIITVINPDYYTNTILKPYSYLAFSSNLNERTAYNRILNNVSNLPPHIKHEKRLCKSLCLKLAELANDSNLDNEQLKSLLHGYRDGWGVIIALSGPHVPYKELGPFTSLNPNEKGNQIINIISDKEKLLRVPCHA